MYESLRTLVSQKTSAGSGVETPADASLTDPSETTIADEYIL